MLHRKRSPLKAIWKKGIPTAFPPGPPSRITITGYELAIYKYQRSGKMTTLLTVQSPFNEQTDEDIVMHLITVQSESLVAVQFASLVTVQSDIWWRYPLRH